MKTDGTRAVVLAALMVLSVAVTGIAVTGAMAQQADDTRNEIKLELSTTQPHSPVAVTGTGAINGSNVLAPQVPGNGSTGQADTLIIKSGGGLDFSGLTLIPPPTSGIDRNGDEAGTAIDKNLVPLLADLQTLNNGSALKIVLQHPVNISVGDEIVISISEANGVTTGDAGHYTMKVVAVTASGQRTTPATVEYTIGNPEPATAPDIAVAPDSVGFGNVTVGQNATETVTVTNNGNATLNVSDVNIAGQNASAYTVTDGLPSTLAPGENATATVEFAPTSAGETSATLEIASNDSDESTVEVALSGTGVAPEPEPVPKEPDIAVAPDSVGFGNVTVGQNATETVTVTNNGNATLNVSDVSIAGQNASAYTVTDGLPSTLAPGENATATVEFAPTSAGETSATLEIASNDSDESTVEVALSGTGVAAPEEGNGTRNEIDLQLTSTQPHTVVGVTGLGAVNGSNVLPEQIPGDKKKGQISKLIVKSGGGLTFSDFKLIPVPVTGIDENGDEPGTAIDVNLVHHLDGVPQVKNNGSTLVINLKPVNVSVYDEIVISTTKANNIKTTDPGHYTMKVIAVTPDGHRTTPATVEYTIGNPEPATAPDIAVAPDSVEFGNVTVGQNATETVTVTNNGNATLNVSDVSIAGQNASAYTVTDGLPSTLAPGENATATVEFAPTSAGEANATLEIASNDSDESTVEVALSGTGVAAPEDNPTASAVFENQTTDGQTVVIEKVTLSEGGFVAIHNASLLNGDTFNSVIGVSEKLSAGTHKNVTVTLFEGVPGQNYSQDALQENQTLVAMPHFDSDGDGVYDFITSNGAKDAPYTQNGSAVVDTAFVTVSMDQPQQPEQKTLTVKGVGEYAFYSFTASGDVDIASQGDTEDTVNNATAFGAVDAGSETYTFTGSLENFYVRGDVQVFVNGEPVDVSQYPSELNTIRFVGTGNYSAYSFNVSGAVVFSNGLDAEDSIMGNHAEGAVAAGQEIYVFTGTLEDLNTTGYVTVTSGNVTDVSGNSVSATSTEEVQEEKV